MKRIKLSSTDIYEYYLIANSLVHPSPGNKARIFEIMITGNHLHSLDRTARHHHYKKLFMIKQSNYDDFTKLFWNTRKEEINE